MSKRKKYRVIDNVGIPCPRCGRKTQAREHLVITSKHTQRQPFYYSRWFCCVNNRCRTTLIMLEEFKVTNTFDIALELLEVR